MSNDSTSAKLQELFDLFQSDALTKEEYESLKAELLNAGSMPVAKGNDLSGQSSLQNVAKKSVYEERIKVDPLNIKLLHEYGQFLISIQLYKETVVIAQKLLAMNQQDVLAKIVLFNAYIKLNYLNEALEIGEQIISHKPNDISLLVTLAKISIKLKDSSKASLFNDKILTIQPSNAAALRYKAITLLNEKQVEDAIEIFKKIIKTGQDDIITSVYVGIGDALNGDFTSAIKFLNPILKKKVDNSTAINRGYLFLTYCLCQSNSDKSEIYQMSSKIDYEVLKKEQLPIDENPRQIIAEYLFNIKLLEVNPAKYPQSQITEAIDFYLNYGGIPQLDKPKIAEAWYIIGIKQVELKLLTDSLTSLYKALDLVPDETRFIEKCAEIKKLILLSDKKRKRKKLLAFSFSIVIIFFMTSVAFIVYRNIEVSKELKAFETAKSENTEKAYESYMKNYPEGIHINEVKDLAQDAFWCNMKNLNTTGGYNAYLAVHPTGKYVKEANEGIRVIKETEQIWNNRQKGLSLWNDTIANDLVLNELKSFRGWEEKANELGKDPDIQLISTFQKIELPNEDAFVALAHTNASTNTFSVSSAYLSLFEFKFEKSWILVKKEFGFTYCRANSIIPEFSLSLIAPNKYGIIIKESLCLQGNCAEWTKIYSHFGDSVKCVLDVITSNDGGGFSGDSKENFKGNLTISREGTDYYPIELIEQGTKEDGTNIDQRIPFKFNGKEYVNTSGMKPYGHSF